MGVTVEKMGVLLDTDVGCFDAAAGDKVEEFGAGVVLEAIVGAIVFVGVAGAIFDGASVSG